MLQKVTAALRMLAYGGFASSLDRTLTLKEITMFLCMSRLSAANVEALSEFRLWEWCEESRERERAFEVRMKYKRIAFGRLVATKCFGFVLI